uniref:Uncharacterized protein n=1 Tax=Ditylum brightwellii TaxID=49249 RepID=A0A6S8X7S8_9STRA
MPIRPRLRSLLTLSPESFSHMQDIGQLIEKERWGKLRRLLSASTTANVLSLFPDVEMMQSALHLLCKRNPPLDIVEKFIEVLPQCPHRIDSEGRTPLHIAVSFEASLSVIDHLISIYPDAASTKDAHGRTPLIVVCQNITVPENAIEFVQINQYFPDLIRYLINASPHTVTDEDCESITALEYAICNDAPAKAIHMLQRAHITVGRTKETEQQKGSILQIEGGHFTDLICRNEPMFVQCTSSISVSALSCSS